MVGVVLIASGKLIAIDFSSPNPISVLAPGTPPRRFWRNHRSCSMLDLPHTGLRLLVQTVVRPCVLCATGKLLKILIFSMQKVSSVSSCCLQWTYIPILDQNHQILHLPTQLPCWCVHSRKVPGSIGSRNGVDGRGSSLYKIVVRRGYTSVEW